MTKPLVKTTAVEDAKPEAYEAHLAFNVYLGAITRIRIASVAQKRAN
jgi:hypothetical protein